MANTNPAREWAALVPSGRPGREIADDLRSAGNSSGTRIIREFSVANIGGDLATLIDQIIQLHPPGVMVWLDAADAGKAVRELRARHYDGVLAGPARLRSAAFIRMAGASADGFIVPFPETDSNCRTRRERFEAAFKQNFGVPPDWIATMSCEAAELLARNEAKLNRRDFLSIYETNGFFGPIYFDAAGNRLLPLVAQVCAKGEFR